ncbi:zinc finger protein 142-like [Nasonia vitripennis]|uniref:C2H2-type domain-containing protein n=1 Tax=Nasonia vitripennis TaxID=7425 RepID=A0A7M7GCR0_NASVI|nr:zinc finger protein 142-like [Nasonia vitripennis]
MLMMKNANVTDAIIDVKKLIAQLSSATVVVQKLPSIKGHLRLVSSGHADKENESNNQCNDNDDNYDDDEFFFKEPGKKRASKISKPFCSSCNATVENHRIRDKYCRQCGTLLLFKCMTCRTQYTSYRGMQIHLKTKCDETTLYIQCSSCDYATNSRIALTKHKKYVHQNIQRVYLEEFYQGQNSNRCEICGKMFKYRCNLTNHLKACKTRESGYLPNNTLKSSENKLIPNKLKTKVNANSVGYSVKYKVQSKTSSVIKYLCLTCNKTKKGVPAHYSPRCNWCESLLILSCKKCSKQYQSWESMKYHLESKCSPGAVYQCCNCSYKSTVKYLMKRHIKNRHISKKPKPLLECSKCGKKSKNSDSLSRHFKFCGVKPNLFCKLCSYKTKYTQNLKKHLMNHSEVDKNNYSDFISNNLRTAENTQKPREEVSDTENKKPDSVNGKHTPPTFLSSNLIPIDMLEACCPLCNQEIKISENIDKKCSNCEATIYFKCKKCNKPISNYYNAKSHLRSCLRINLIPCKYCKKKIDDCGQFKRHFKYCESKALYGCRYCGFRGKSKSDINAHKKRCKRIKSTGKTETVKPIVPVQEAESNVKDEIIASKEETIKTIQEAQDNGNGVLFSVNGIDIIEKRITENIPKITEMATRYCPKCKRTYEGSNCVKSFCGHCNKIELHHKCQKCEKAYKHTVSLFYHLQSQCFPTTEFTCTLCNYSNYVKSEIMKHAKHNKHASLGLF